MARSVSNFINGESVPAADGRTLDVINPATGEVYLTSPLSGAEDVDRAYSAAATAFESWRRQHPERSAAGAAEVRRRDRGPGRGDSSRSRARTPASRSALTRSEEVPPMVDQIRFFAGAARVLEGKSAGEYLAGHTSYVRREPIGVCGQVAPWNYPMMMAVWKFAPALAAGNTVVLKPSDTTPASLVAAGRDRRRVLPARRVQRGLRRPGHRPRRWSRTGPRPWSRSPARPGPASQVAAGGRRGPQAGAPGAGRQGAGHRVRRRRHRRGGRGDRGGRLLQRRPGLHRRHPGAGPGRVRRRVRGRPGRAGRARPGPAPPTTRTCCTARSTTPTSWRTSPAWSTGCPTTPGCWPAARRQGEARLLLPADRAVRPARRTTSRSRPRSSARSSPCRPSPTRTRRSAGPTASSTAWPPRSGPRTTAARCGCRRRLDFGCVWVNTHIPLVAEMPHGGFKHSGYGKDLSMYGLEDYTRIKHVMHDHRVLTSTRHE